MLKTMNELSRAAGRSKTSDAVTKMLGELPSPVVSMRTDDSDKVASGAVTLLVSSALLVIVVGLMIGYALIPLAIGPLILALGFALEASSKAEKLKVIKALELAAKDAVEGKNVSISEYLESKMKSGTTSSDSYVEKLNNRQQRWIAKRWDKEFTKATERAMIAENDTVTRHVDTLLDTNKAKKVFHHKKALEELRSVLAKTDEDRFDSEFNKLTKKL